MCKCSGLYINLASNVPLVISVCLILTLIRRILSGYKLVQASLCIQHAPEDAARPTSTVYSKKTRQITSLDQLICFGTSVMRARSDLRNAIRNEIQRNRH